MKPKKNKAAAALGRKGGLKGGLALKNWYESLTPEEKKKHNDKLVEAKRLKREQRELQGA